MKWYFGFNEHASKWFADMVRVAIASAATHAPQLEPHCLYDGEAETRPDALAAWPSGRDSPCRRPHPRAAWPRRTSWPAMPGVATTRWRRAATTCAWPSPEAAGDGDEHVLFTDCDVMFTGPVDLSSIRPALIAAAPEMLDVRHPAPGAGGARLQLRRHRDERGRNAGADAGHRRGAGTRRLPYLPAGAVHLRPGRAQHGDSIGGEWERLPDILNWRPAFGINPRAAIVHWHGPKPRHIGKTLATGVTSAPDATMRGMIDAAPEAYRHYYEMFSVPCCATAKAASP